eukprot:4670506-Pyramimonas_sp.AAC.1
MDVAEIVRDTCLVECMSVTDCMSLLEACPGGGYSTQSIKEVSIEWVKSEQMRADCSTKVFPGGYARKNVRSK